MAQFQMEGGGTLTLEEGSQVKVTEETLAQAGQTLGLSNTYIFWRIRMPCCIGDSG